MSDTIENYSYSRMKRQHGFELFPSIFSTSCFGYSPHEESQKEIWGNPKGLSWKKSIVFIKHKKIKAASPKTQSLFPLCAEESFTKVVLQKKTSYKYNMLFACKSLCFKMLLFSSIMKIL